VHLQSRSRIVRYVSKEIDTDRWPEDTLREGFESDWIGSRKLGRRSGWFGSILAGR
jgi:hypothetical protein